MSLLVTYGMEFLVGPQVRPTPALFPGVMVHIGGAVVTGMQIFMFFTALMQYNSNTHSFTTNARLRREYKPGSEMFVVFSDGRDTLNSGFPTMVNRAFIVKVNHLFRF